MKRCKLVRVEGISSKVGWEICALGKPGVIMYEIKKEVNHAERTKPLVLSKAERQVGHLDGTARSHATASLGLGDCARAVSHGKRDIF